MEKLLKFNIHGNNNNSNNSNNNNSYYYYNSSTMDSVLFFIPVLFAIYGYRNRNSRKCWKRTHLYTHSYALWMCVPVQMTLVNAIWASARMSRHTQMTRSESDGKQREKEKKANRRARYWIDYMVWGHGVVRTQTQIQTASGLLLLLLLLFPHFICSSSSFLFFFSALFAFFSRSRFYFILLTIRNSVLHTFLTIYVLYFFPFFNFLSSNASFVSNTVQIVSRSSTMIRSFARSHARTLARSFVQCLAR